MIRWTSFSCVFFQAEDGIRYLVRSRGLGDVYKRQVFENNASYLAGWLKVLKEDSRFVFKVSAQAQKAVDYILN